jgi:hypothetical protein
MTFYGNGQESLKKGAKPLPQIDFDCFQSGQAIHIFGQMFAAR